MIKKLSLTLLTLSLAACAAPSDPYAQPNDAPIPYVTGSTYSCTPADFTLTQSSVLDTGGEYHVEGTLDMPTPGYSTRVIERPSTRLDEQNFEIYTTRPSGMVTQVISPLDVSFNFSGTPTLNRVNIYVVNSDGSASMGVRPNTITCTALR